MNFLPHRFCYLNDWWLIGTIGLSDLFIGLAYLFIGAVLYRIAQAVDLPWGWMLWCFGTFILLCGMGHWVDDLTLWYGWYWMTAVVRVATAVASTGTAYAVLLVFRRLHLWRRHAEAAAP